LSSGQSLNFFFPAVRPSPPVPAELVCQVGKVFFRLRVKRRTFVFSPSRRSTMFFTALWVHSLPGEPDSDSRRRQIKGGFWFVFPPPLSSSSLTFLFPRLVEGFFQLPVTFFGEGWSYATH